MTTLTNFNNTNIETLIANVYISGDIIRFADDSVEIVLVKMGEYTVLIHSESNYRNIIGSTGVFDRVHHNIRTNSCEMDKYMDPYDKKERTILYLDYGTGLFLKNSNNGVTLVANEV